MKLAVIFTAIEGVGTPHLETFKLYNPTVPYFVAEKPADLHFNHHMDDTIVECWAQNREGLDVDYVIHADYDTRIACDVTRALDLDADKLVDVLTNAYPLGGRGVTLNLIAFKRSLMDLMVDHYATFNPDSYCELRIVEFCKAHDLHINLMPPDVCHEMSWNERNVAWWENRFAHPIKFGIDDFAGAFNVFGVRSDKNSTHAYGPMYDKLLSAYKGRPVNLLEVGVLVGDSLHTWQAFLGPDACITGMDVNLPVEMTTPKRPMTLIVGDSTKPETADRLPDAYFDIIIDDGDHVCMQQLKTYNNLIGKLKPDGIYIIEDIQRKMEFEHVFKDVDYTLIDLIHVKSRYDDCVAVMRGPQAYKPTVVEYQDYELVWMTGDNCPAYHAEVFSHYNPGVVSHIHKHDDSVDWRNCDRNIIQWWLANKDVVTADVIVFADYDTRIAQPLKLPKSQIRGMMLGDVNALPKNNWWYSDYEKLPDPIKSVAIGGAPMALVVLTRDALDKISDACYTAVFDMDIFSEVRLASVARHAGVEVYSVEKIFKNIWEPTLSAKDAESVGIWHPVKYSIPLQ